jgi:hypothetical protein
MLSEAQLDPSHYISRLPQSHKQEITTNSYVYALRYIPAPLSDPNTHTHLRDQDDLSILILEHNQIARDTLSRVHIRQDRLIERVGPGPVSPAAARFANLTPDTMYPRSSEHDVKVVLLADVCRVRRRLASNSDRDFSESGHVSKYVAGQKQRRHHSRLQTGVSPSTHRVLLISMSFTQVNIARKTQCPTRRTLTLSGTSLFFIANVLDT